MTDLWILPPPSHSAWFAKIDWFLNWQMCKGLAHETRRPSVELLRLAQETGVTWFDPPRLEAPPLLVIARGRVPAAGCLVLSAEEKLRDWLERLHTLVPNLRTHRLRVFLPIAHTVAEATKIWASLPKTDLAIEFTADEESSTWPMQSRTN